MEASGAELIEAVELGLITYVVRLAPKPVNVEALCVTIYGTPAPPESRAELLVRAPKQYAQ